MKNVKSFIRSFIAMAVISAVMTSCSNDDGENLPVNPDPVKKGKLIQGDVDFSVLGPCVGTGAKKSVTYKLISVKSYFKDDLSKGKWKKKPEDVVGGELSLPDGIVISEGTYWQPIRSFSCATGPTAFAVALAGVNKVSGKNYSAYVSKSLDVDPNSFKLMLGKKEYGIVGASGNYIVLSDVEEYLGGRTGNGGQSLELGTYEEENSIIIDGERVLGFDSEVDAYDWLIEQFRNYFGEEMNMNLIIGNAILDNPGFHISRLEKERAEYIGSK